MDTRSGLRLNRREFCLAAGAVALAGAVPTVAGAAQADEAAHPAPAFRIRKIFPQRQVDATVHLPEIERAAFFRAHFREIRETFDAILLPTLAGVPRSFIRFAVPQARAAGIPLFLPGSIPMHEHAGFDRFEFLTATAESLETDSPDHASPHDGLLISGPNGDRFIVLYDLSRCTWKAYSDGLPDENAAEIIVKNKTDSATARLLDRILKPESALFG